MSCDSFHLFPLLPTELRLRIWTFTFPGSRVLELLRDKHEWLCATESRQKPHLAAFANREAHEHFLRKWFRITLPRAILTTDFQSLPAVSYFNPRIDVLYIGGARLINPARPEAISALAGMHFVPSVQFLAVEIQEWDSDHMLPPDWELAFFANFPNLESFIIADYDIDSWRLFSEDDRPRGEIELVTPMRLHMDDPQEMAPSMIKRLVDLARSHPEANMPCFTVKEVLRGGVKMDYD